MRTRTLLTVAFSITVLLCFVPVCRAQYCDFPPKELVQGEHREYRGPYENRAYGYSVVIPANLVGYDDVNPFYQHGFGIVVGTGQPSYIFVDGEPNSLEFARPTEAASQFLEYVRKHGNKVESSGITDTEVGQLKAALLVATYTCPGLPERYVVASTFVISPDKSKLYEVSLYAHEGHFEQDKAVLEAIVKSWRHLSQDDDPPSAFDKCRVVTTEDVIDKRAPAFGTYRVTFQLAKLICS